MHKEKLEVINENDEVVGLESRDVIHEKGLLHREIHVWFMTPAREIIFQHRSKNKDTYPDKLDATVGGHVEPGMSYIDTAIKEAQEETGITLDLSKLKLIKKMHQKTFDDATGRTNNTIRSQYVYLFEGNINDLHVEEGSALGFEAWPIEDLPHLSPDDKEKFISLILSKEFLDIFNEGEKVLGLK